MNYSKRFEDIPEYEFFPGFHGRMIHTDTMTLALWRIEKGSELKNHSHANDQITHLIKGELELQINGQTETYKSGDYICIPPHAEHGGKAKKECIVFDIFHPVREDYKR